MVSHEFLINCLITLIYPTWQAGPFRPAGHRPDPGLTFGNPGLLNSVQWSSCTNPEGKLTTPMSKRDVAVRILSL